MFLKHYYRCFFALGSCLLVLLLAACNAAPVTNNPASYQHNARESDGHSPSREDSRRYINHCPDNSAGAPHANQLPGQ